MLNPFPELLTYSLLAPFILRVVLGVILIDLGLLKFKGERAKFVALFDALRLKPAELLVNIAGIINIVGGLMLVVGIYTQVAALVFALFALVDLYIEWKDDALLKRDIVFYVLTLAISVSLLIQGAGAFAFDIPL